MEPADGDQANDDSKADETQDVDKDSDESSAFGWLCVILVMFGNLDRDVFVA